MVEDALVNDDELDVVGCLPRLLPPSHRDEFFQIVGKVRLVVNSEAQGIRENNFARFVKLLDIYQEQPALLDCIIRELIDILLSYISLPVGGKPFSKLDEVSVESLQYLAHLTKVRGYKIVVRLLPHHVSYLDKILTVLESYNEVDSLNLVERRMLLMWLWFICKNPFDFAKFDPVEQPGRTMRRIFSVCTPFIDVPHFNGSQRAAALVLSQCLSRADGALLLPNVVLPRLERIRCKEDLHGNLILLLSIFKHVDRIHALSLVDDTAATLKSFYPLDTPEVDIRNFIVKMVQRVALVLLPPRVASWRYKRGRRKLEDNLSCVSAAPTVQNNGHNGDSITEMQVDEGEDSEDGAEPHYLVEWALECVLLALCDSDTPVRWSAAKGVGRIASRLPRYLASQVVQTIVSHNFHHLSGNGAWHGGCLALAELSRRGFLLPEDLPMVFPVIKKALFYEEPMGRHALGSNVRDAACYILWAFARAYEPLQLRPYVEDIATSLMCVALFDRQVNLRRAASAAFQENVGRQAEFPDGVKLITVADYFAVGNRQRCYTQLCTEVVKFANYANAIVDHLVECKVVHWDSVVREQAASALQCLAPFHASYIATKLPFLLKGCEENSATKRHGFLLAFSRALAGLLDSGFAVEQHIVSEAAVVPFKLKAESTKVKAAGGEFTRLALASYIRCLSNAKMVLEHEHVVCWLSLLETTCMDDTAIVRSAAISAALEFIPTYLVHGEGLSLLNSVQQTYSKQMSTSTRENALIGLCSMCAAIPYSLFSENLFNSLAELVIRPSSSAVKWASARAAAIKTVCAVYKNSSDSKWADAGFEMLFRGMEDYTEDSRGDIGRHVREAAMRGISEILISDGISEDIRNHFTPLAIKKMVQQSAERIGRTRECACNSILLLMDNKKCTEFIVSTSILRTVYKEGLIFIQDSVLSTLYPLLLSEHYFLDVLTGLIFSAGGISDVTVKHALTVINKYVNYIFDDFLLVERLVGAVAGLFSKGMRNFRLGNAVLRYLPRLLERLPDGVEFVDGSESLERIWNNLNKVMSSKRSPVRLRLCLEAFSAMLSFSQESKLWRRSVVIMIDALLNPLPAIRRCAAESLYDALCVVDVENDVLEVLSKTCWHSTNDLVVIEEAASSIRSHFKFDLI